MASIFHKLGGAWFFFIGAPLAAWFILQFWIIPLFGPALGIPAAYAFNISTILALSNPLGILLFVALWFGLSLGYFGGNLYMHRGHRR